MGLERFIKAQQNSYPQALAEIRKGRKQSHWMWFIFPQLKGLGKSATADYYGINGMAEASAYLSHPLLGDRLIVISAALLELKTGIALDVFGSPDHIKLRSSMTLFSQIENADPVFTKVLEKYFGAIPDKNTLYLLNLK